MAEQHDIIDLQRLQRNNQHIKDRLDKQDGKLSELDEKVGELDEKVGELELKVDDLNTELGRHYEDSGILLNPTAIREGVYPRIDSKTYQSGTNNNSGVFDVSAKRYLHVRWSGINTAYFGIALTNDANTLTNAHWLAYPSSSGEMDVDTMGYNYAVLCVDYNGAFRGDVSERKAIDLKNSEDIFELKRMKLTAKFGKNLFDKDTATLGYYFNSASGDTGVSGSYYISDYIPVQPNTAYHISAANDNALGFSNAYMIAYGIDKEVVGGTPVSNTQYTTPSNAAFLRLSIYNTRIEYAQVEIGNARTAYESFSAVKGYANELSPRPFDGKIFYSIGDSIAYQEQWQGKLADMRGLNYITAATKSLTAPLGIGGSTICPRIQVQTTSNALPAKYPDGTPVKDFNGNALYFLEGRGVGQSIYVRSAWFANTYSDAEVVVINGGQNDEKAFSYNSAGAPSDLPYEGKEYVVAKYANIAKAYGGTAHTIAILDDGSATLPSEFLDGDYTILTEAPTFASCLAGVIKRICTGVPTAIVVGNSLLPSNMPLTSQTGGRTERADMMSKVYRQNRIPFANMYDGLGANEYNFSHYFIDNYHPNGEGGLRMAAILSHIL